MIVAAEGQLRLEEQVVGGGTVAAHNRQLARSKKMDPEQYLTSVVGAPPIPDVLRFLWEAFCELSIARPHGFSGPQPIAYSEILAWGTLQRVNLTPWDVEIIRALDVVALRYFHEREVARNGRRTPPGQPPRRNGR